MATERCEFNPVLLEAALDPPRPTDCPNEATECVGSAGAWHICGSCIDLPFFDRFRYRKPLRRALASPVDKEPQR